MLLVLLQKTSVMVQYFLLHLKSQQEPDAVCLAADEQSAKQADLVQCYLTVLQWWAENLWRSSSLERDGVVVTVWHLYLCTAQPV
mmetsp:Transcript_13718/g.34231  ORF Transcript_13718/g.34231 Transcript_13718/m.34231 type:complete len:85 (+) Transcript_13718:1142-1396(+)